jgi:hypothetical protein
LIQIGAQDPERGDADTMLTIKPEAVCYVTFRDRQDDEWEPASDPVADARLDLELATLDPKPGQSSGQSKLAVFITELPIDH